jgi:protein-L-isoaspartate(D-aspartate) O-methyltransferase
MAGHRNELRAFHASLMAAASGSDDPRLARVFKLVPREAFLPPGPWKISGPDGRYHETPSDDPAYIYQNNIVALDAAREINNGEPFLHASWIGAVMLRPGERVCHIGAGSGYYTAILSVLAAPGGSVEAFEIDEALARAARHNLEPYEGVSVTHANATEVDLPASDVIYVNAGVLAPPPAWLRALRPGGRLIFPWRPSEETGLAMLVTKLASGKLRARPLAPAYFIPCTGGASARDRLAAAPDAHATATIRSIWLTSERTPDESAIAAYEHVWFSSLAVE